MALSPDEYSVERLRFNLTSLRVFLHTAANGEKSYIITVLVMSLTHPFTICLIPRGGQIKAQGPHVAQKII